MTDKEFQLANLTDLTKSLGAAAQEMGDLKTAVAEETRVRKNQNRWIIGGLCILLALFLFVGGLFLKEADNSTKICEAVNSNKTTLTKVLDAAAAAQVPRTPPANATPEQLKQFKEEEAQRAAASKKFYATVKKDLTPINC